MLGIRSDVSRIPPPVAEETDRLRYYMHDRASSFRFKLAGALAGDDVVELEQCWSAASSTLAGRAFVVDLSELSAVDEVGRELLSRWHTQGAEFIATSSRSRWLAESITGLAHPPASPDRASVPAWLTCRIVSILALVLVTLMVPVTAWSAQLSPSPKLLLTRYAASLRMEGNPTGQAQVIAHYLSAEDIPSSSVAVSAANYRFRYLSAIGTGRKLAYVFEITPRRRQVGLIRGELWIDVSSGIAVRIAGRMVKSPSASQRRIDVIQDTDIREGRPYLRITRLDIETRPAGRGELTVIERPSVIPSHVETAAVTGP